MTSIRRNTLALHGLRPGDGVSGDLLQTDGSKFVFATAIASKNYLYNGGFRVAQRGTSFTTATVPINDDGNYLLDRWLLLSEDANDIVDVSQETTIVPANAFASIALDVETANRQFGICQILEERDSVFLAGQTVSLSFEARISAGGTSIDHLRAAVLGWSGTADTVTSDVVGTWEAAGTNHILATSWNYENTPASLDTLTTSFQTFKIENVSITAGRGNIAVFIWVDDDTLTATHILYIGNVKLEVSNVATTFIPETFQADLAGCQRYFERQQFAEATDQRVWMGITKGINTHDFPIPYSEKRVAPSVTSSDAATFKVTGTAATVIMNALTFDDVNVRQCTGAGGSGSTYGGAAGEAAITGRDTTDTTFIDVDAEL